jgi:hypothetical protein
MKHKIKKQTEEKQSIDLLNTQIKTKYPPGSYIMFEGFRKKEEKLTTLSCCYYDKVGGERPLKNIVRNPPEWQNLPVEEASKICDMFDRHFSLVLVSVKRP